MCKNTKGGSESENDNTILASCVAAAVVDGGTTYASADSRREGANSGKHLDGTLITYDITSI